MIEFITTFLSGSGTIPKDIGIGSLVQIDASSNGATSYEWTILSKPAESTAIIQNPGASAARFGPLDVAGVYLVKLDINSYEAAPQSRVLALSAPGTVSALPAAPDPLFDTGGNVLNFSFELPGILQGWAADWNIEDTADLLDKHAGTARGRITPLNFDTSSGAYVFCLGDDISNTASVDKDSVFSISQEVDLTNVTTLRVTIKYRAS
jgi:hypothetical protein